MKFHTRKWVKPEDLNPNGTLFGGRLLAWIDEEAAFVLLAGDLYDGDWKDYLAAAATSSSLASSPR